LAATGSPQEPEARATQAEQLRALNTSSDEERTLEAFGYRQELGRSMGAFSAFALSFSGIGITAAVFATIGFVWSQGGPAGIWTWPIASVFIVLLGLVFAEISTKVPLSGVSFQWASRLSSPHLGYFVGLFAYIAFQIGVVSTDLVFAKFFTSTIGIQASQSISVIIAVISFVVQGGLLVGGLRIATKINNVAVVTEIVAGLVAGLALLIWALATHHHGFGYSFNTGTAAGKSYLVPFALSFLLPIFTFSAWEAPADLAEETVSSTSTTPRAMIRSIIMTAVIGWIMLLGFTLAMPSLKSTIASDDPGFLIVGSAFGSALANAFLVVVDISIFATGLAILAMAARVLFSMARDGVAPGSKYLSRVHPKTHSPIHATVAVTLVAVVVTIVAQKLTYVSQVASVFYALVYLIVTGIYIFSRNRFSSPVGAFTMGRAGRPVMVVVLAFMVFAVGSLTVPSINRNVAETSLGFLGLVLLSYLASLRPIRALHARRSGDSAVRGAASTSVKSEDEID
jgi:amino acid transporter